MRRKRNEFKGGGLIDVKYIFIGFGIVIAVCLLLDAFGLIER